MYAFVVLSPGVGRPGSWHPCVVTGLALSLSMHDENGALPYHYPVITEGKPKRSRTHTVSTAQNPTGNFINLGVPKGRFGDPLVAVAKTVGSPSTKVQERCSGPCRSLLLEALWNPQRRSGLFLWCFFPHLSQESVSCRGKEVVARTCCLPARKAKAKAYS